MRRPLLLALAAVLAVGTAAAALFDRPKASASADAAQCRAPPSLTAIGPSLDHVAKRVKAGEPLTVVALGSSSTRGFGATSPDRTYPRRLEAELRARLPDIALRVVNRGKNGEEVPQMLARLDRDVLAEHPDLVIWQLGTNAVLHNQNVPSEREPIMRGIARLRQSGADVVLMDLQYAPRIVAKPSYAAMEQIIADAAERAHVGLFRRFAIMQQWRAAQSDDRPRMIGRDGIHMTDRGYACLAVELADALSVNWRARPGPARDGGDESVARIVTHPAVAYSSAAQ